MTETYQMLYDKYDMVAASTLATATNYNARDILTRNVYQKLVPVSGQYVMGIILAAFIRVITET